MLSMSAGASVISVAGGSHNSAHLNITDASRTTSVPAAASAAAFLHDIPPASLWYVAV